MGWANQHHTCIRPGHCLGGFLGRAIRWGKRKYVDYEGQVMERWQHGKLHVVDRAHLAIHEICGPALPPLPGLCPYNAPTVIYGHTDTFWLVEPPLPLLPAHPLPCKPLPRTLAHLHESISCCALFIIAKFNLSDAMSMEMWCQLKCDVSCIRAVFSSNSSGVSCMMTARVWFIARRSW